MKTYTLRQLIIVIVISVFAGLLLSVLCLSVQAAELPMKIDTIRYEWVNDTIADSTLICESGGMMLHPGGRTGYGMGATYVRIDKYTIILHNRRAPVTDTTYRLTRAQIAWLREMPTATGTSGGSNLARPPNVVNFPNWSGIRINSIINRRIDSIINKTLQKNYPPGIPDTLYGNYVIVGSLEILWNSDSTNYGIRVLNQNISGRGSFVTDGISGIGIPIPDTTRGQQKSPDRE